MISYKKFVNRENIILIFIVLFFIHLFDGFENTFKIIKRSYD